MFFNELSHSYNIDHGFRGLIQLTKGFFFFFLINFFSNFVSIMLSGLRIRHHDLFCLLFIMLFWPHDPRIMLNGLTRVDSSYFLCYFFNWFFFNFIIRYWVGLKLSFIIYFDFFSIGISWSYDQGRGFWHYIPC